MDIISIWYSLHSSLTNPPDYGEYLEEIAPETERFQGELALLDALSEVEKQRWALLAEAVGWTQVAAMGLSWCKNASMDEVLRAWREAGKVGTDVPQVVSSAQLTCPGILPDPRISTILRSGEDFSGVWIILMAINFNKIRVEMDQPIESLTSIYPSLRKLLEANASL